MADLTATDSKLAISAAGSTYTDIAGIKELSINGSVDKYDKTDHDSGSSKESGPGRSEHTISCSGNYDEADAGQGLLRTAYFGKTVYYFRARPATATGAYGAVAQGFVTSYKVTMGNDGYVQFSADIQLTGSLTWAAQS